MHARIDPMVRSATDRLLVFSHPDGRAGFELSFFVQVFSHIVRVRASCGLRSSRTKIAQYTHGFETSLRTSLSAAVSESAI